jgi:hypothetical protein
MTKEEKSQFDRLLFRLQMAEYGRNQLFFLWLILLPLISLPLFMASTEIWLGTILVTLALFLLGHYIYRRHVRIERVVSEYLTCFRSGDYTNGLDALLKSGVCELSNRFELNEVCRKICKRETKAQHPNDCETELPNRKLFAFLKFCHKHKKDISSASDTLAVILQFNGEI